MVYKIQGIMDWFFVLCLYFQAFPREERKPFRIIYKMWRMGKSDVWCIRDHGRFCGFANTLRHESLVLIDYLAVKKKYRRKGIGTKILKGMQTAYEGYGLFVEIESIFEDAPDLPARLQRRKFYKNCGFAPMGVLACVFGVPMELLGWNCRFDYARYETFYRYGYHAKAAEHLSPMEYPEVQN